RRSAIDRPPEAEAFRAHVRAFIAQYQTVPDAQKRKALADSGYLVPHWPRPWGREAGAVEQLVIDQEFAAAGVRRPELGISGWNTLAIAPHRNAEPLARLGRPSPEGEIELRQLVSHPNPG